MSRTHPVGPMQMAAMTIQSTRQELQNPVFLGAEKGAEPQAIGRGGEKEPDLTTNRVFGKAGSLLNWSQKVKTLIFNI